MKYIIPVFPLATRHSTLATFSRLVSALTLLFISSFAFAQTPILTTITRGAGTLFLLGGTELPSGTRWQSDAISRAIDSSDSLIVLVPPADPDNDIPPLRQDIYPSVDMHPIAIEEGYGNLGFGDYMDVSMGERSVVESQRLNLNGNWYRPMQPWVAYYYFGYNFWDQQGLELTDPELTLVETFQGSGKPVSAVLDDRAGFFRLMGSMSDGEQTQLFQSLYNIMDWQRANDYAARYAWAEGAPFADFLELHRTQTPLFYQFWYAAMNQRIADTLTALLDDGGIHFAYLEASRLLGEHSVIALLTARGANVSPQD